MTQRKWWLALLGTVEKWRLVCYEGGEDRGAYNCPLCLVKDENGNDQDCGNCPIGSTGAWSCGRTPHDAWLNHHLRTYGHSGGSLRVKPGCVECQRLAEEELDYLCGITAEELVDWSTGNLFARAGCRQ